MNYIFLKRATLIAVGVAISGRFADAAIISNHLPNATANWSAPATWSTNPVIPDGVGDTIRRIAAMNGNRTLTQDIAGTRTIGTLQYGESNDLTNRFWAIGLTNTNTLTFNQDGNGPDVARMINTNTNAGNFNALLTNGGTVILADDLHVINQSNGINDNGGVQLASIVTGTGNITFINHKAISIVSPTSTPGAIWMNSANTFVGNSTVEKGLVAINLSATPFGVATNLVTLGKNGSGSAAILVRDNVSALNYAITVDSAAVGETRTLGSNANASYTVSTGDVTLNGDLILRAGTTGATFVQGYTGDFSGVGGLTKNGPAIAALSGANTYQGATNIDAGRLYVNGTHTGGGTYTVLSGATLGGTGSIDAAVAVNGGGFLSPGTSIESLDVGSVSGAGTLLIEYDYDAGTPIDLLNVAGNLDISSLILDFNNIDSVPTPLPVDGGGFGTGAYVFAKYGSLTGAAFANVVDLPAGYYVDYAFNDGMSSNNIAIVPEPSTLFVVGTGVVALALIRKRRTK